MPGMSLSVRYRLRLLWYRLDREALVFVSLLGGVGAAFALVVAGVFAWQEEREAHRAAVQRENLTCLARNIYFEARGEPLAGQYAVAEVTMNRKSSPRYPDTVCEVVYQRAAFSWTDFKRLPEPEGDEWERAQQIAEAVYYGKRSPVLGGALYYHATRIRPPWAKEKQRVARIGRHVFYR